MFSYANGRISQIGLVETAAVTAPKPPEFGTAGDNWRLEGWLVRVNWQPLLPERHSPISTSPGRGNQGVYLAGLSETLGLLLLKLLDDMQRLREVPSSTERDALTKARLGQGLFSIGWRSWSRPAGSRAWHARSSWWRATSNPGDPATTANG